MVGESDTNLHIKTYTNVTCNRGETVRMNQPFCGQSKQFSPAESVTEGQSDKFVVLWVRNRILCCNHHVHQT